INEPTQPKKRSLPLVILTVVGALIIIALGSQQLRRGWNEMFGAGEDASFKQRIEESNKALDRANKFNGGAAPQLTELQKDAQRLGLRAFHEQQTVAARQVGEQFHQAAIEFRKSAEKLTAAADSQSNETMKRFAEQKSKSLNLAAEVCDLNH